MMIPEIAFDFNFDYVMILIFGSYILYGYISGGHKQIRLSINLILPFLILYYLGKYITAYLYVPLSDSFVYQIINEFLPIAKYTLGMIIAYLITYFVLFFGVFILSIYARRYVLNENMRAKLGKYNNYLGALFALINGYVLVYFIILPVFSLNVIGEEAVLTNFILENPPPFSRIARTAEKAVPIKGLADKAADFQQLLSAEGIEGYYNEAIYDYQQTYMGSSNSKEEIFMETVYPELSEAAKTLLDGEYLDYFGETLSYSNYLGISRVLVEEYDGDQLVYEAVLEEENNFDSVLQDNLDIANQYEASILQYEIDSENYLYQVAYEAYVDDMETYLDAWETYMDAKLTAILAGDQYNTEFTMDRPELDVEEPDNYQPLDPLVEPTDPTGNVSPADQAAIQFVEDYEDKEDVRSTLKSLGKDFNNHKGLLMWYVDELDREMATSSTSGDISETIFSFKNYYPTIRDNINDEELESKLYLAQMSIVTYDVFTLWLDCTQENIDNVPLEELGELQYRCSSLNLNDVTEYDFSNDAFDAVKTLFEGESVSWIIVQYKYDYEAGIFDEYFQEFEEVQDILASTKELVDEYDLYYKDIANSIDGNVSMVIKIGISVMKYHLDIYDTLENTPLLAAFFNDSARMCSNSDVSPLNRDVTVCPKTEGEGGFLKELFNMRYLASEIVFKAYIMVDDDNEPIIYDPETMNEFLAKTNAAVENNVISAEVVEQMGDQFAFNIIDETNNYTLLEQMYDDGQITIEAMRILADDEYDLFSDEFSFRVRSLIR